MSLEDAIQNLADAINNHAAVLAQTIGAPVAEKTVEVKKAATSVKADTPVSDTKAAGSGASDAKKTSASTASVEKATTTESADAADTTTAPSEEVDVNVLKEKFAKLIEDDIGKAKAILTELGFPKLNLVPANLHAKALELVEAALPNG